MKNIYTLLSEIGVEIPEEKKAEFDTAVNENYKTVAEVEKLRTARDNYKEQLETAQETLKGFEGVDVKDLQGKIATLQTDLAAKETEYQGKLSEMEFNTKLDGLLSKAGAKSAKAARALLGDLDALKTSKNQDADLQAAIDACKTDNGYLFGVDEPINSPVARTTGTPENPLAAVRAAMGLSAETK